MLNNSAWLEHFVTALAEDMFLLLVRVVNFVFASNAQLLGYISLLTFGQIVNSDAGDLSLFLTDTLHAPKSGLKLQTELA